MKKYIVMVFIILSNFLPISITKAYARPPVYYACFNNSNSDCEGFQLTDGTIMFICVAGSDTNCV